jgi:hypothetical protein
VDTATSFTLSLAEGAYGELLACHTKGVRALARGAYSFLAPSLVLHLFDPRFARFCCYRLDTKGLQTGTPYLLCIVLILFAGAVSSRMSLG